MALSSSVSLAKLVEPIVSVLVSETVLRLPMISSNASLVNLVLALMFRLVPMLRMLTAVRFAHPANMLFMSVTLLASNAGTVVRW